MDKITDLYDVRINIVILALTYLKLSKNIEMVSFSKLKKYNQTVEHNMKDMGSNFDTVRTCFADDPHNFFVYRMDTDGNYYALINDIKSGNLRWSPLEYLESEINMEFLISEWLRHITIQDIDLINASVLPNALDVLEIDNPEKINEFLTDILSVASIEHEKKKKRELSIMHI